MVECPICGESLSPPTIRCHGCGAELHRKCANKILGRWYCKGCSKEAKKRAKFERMAQRELAFGTRKPKKLW